MAAEDIERRVTALEQEVGRMRRDVADARILAGGADRDVAEMREELRAHTRVLNALRETQVDHGTRLDRLESEMRRGFAVVNVGMTKILELLEQRG